MEYFFDSYAIIRIINQDESYFKFKDQVVVTNSLNLAEVYYFLLRNYNEKTADYWKANLNFVFLEITPELSIKAAKFRYKHKNLKVSYADCIGYITALENNMKFITGDNKFKNMEGVEFID